MNNYVKKLQAEFQRDMTVTSLKVVITLWAIMVILLAWSINNGWLLAGILAYEVLP